MKRFVVACAGFVALATGVALAPIAMEGAATAVLTASHGTVSKPHFTIRQVTIAAPRHVSLETLSNAAGGQHRDVTPPFRYFNASRTATARAAAIRSGGRRSGVRSLATPKLTSPSTVQDLQLMSLATQVAAPFGADQNLQPPDTQVAAGPGFLVEVVNSSLSIWNDTGGQALPVRDLNAFFQVPTGFSFGDPRVLYDALSGHWFISGWSADSSNDSFTYLAVSATSDPVTTTWIMYTIQNNSTNNTITDQPMMGVCQDKVVVAWNQFSGTGNSVTYEGADALVLQKTAAVAGSLPPTDTALVANSGEFRMVPAQSLSSSTTCYMTVNNAADDLPGPTTSGLGVIAITGDPGVSTVTPTETDLPITTTNPPPDPSQPGGATNDVQNDDRLLSAVWQNNVLWTSGTDACTPAGDTTTRNCMRLDEVSTSGAAPTLDQDFDLATNGLDQYYPAVSLDPSGDLFVAYSASSSTQSPGAFAVISPASSVDSFTTPLTIQPGEAPYNGGTTPRWGDYSAAAPDPSVAGDVWVAGEYAPSDAASGDWGTAAAEVSLPTGFPAITSTSEQTFQEGTAGTFAVSATGNPTITITETGTLPADATFSSGTLTFSATPATGNGGTYPIQFTATNGLGSVTQAFTLTVTPTGPLYTPVNPVRVLDTRDGTGGFTTPVGPNAFISLKVAGVAGVPSSGVTAVALNVTATDTTASSYVSVYPDGLPRSSASNLNFTAGETIPNMVVVPVGADGEVDFYNHVGSVDLVADLAGYYSATGESAFVPVSPVRLLDTRDGTGTGGIAAPVPPGGTINLLVTDRAGVPASGVTAVVLNVTATDTTASSYVTVYPLGQAQPISSNLNFTAGETIPNQVVVPVGDFGAISLFNHVGSVDLVADLAGYYTAGGSSFNPAGPVRVLDTRDGTGGFTTPVGQNAFISLKVAGVDGVPASGVTAVILNVTATDTTASSYVSVYPDGQARSSASSLNFTAGETIPNLVVVPVGADGEVDFYNHVGSVDLVADLAGYYTN